MTEFQKNSGKEAEKPAPLSDALNSVSPTCLSSSEHDELHMQLVAGVQEAQEEVWEE